MLGGYHIPKGTQVMGLATSVMKSPDYFPNPDTFDPDRFMVDGKFYQDPKMITFSVGKRRCLGESLARLELYLFFTHMLQAYTVSPRPGQELTMKTDSTGTIPI